MVVGQTLLNSGTSGHRVRTRVLNLLNEVLVTLLGEAAALLGVEVHVVTPDLEGGAVGVVGKVRGEVEVEADLVVLEGDEGEGQTGVAVEEEDEGEVDGTGGEGAGGAHLTPRGLLGLIEVELGVQTPPALVVLVDALTTDGQLNILDGTLGGPAGGGAGEGGVGSKLNIHIGDEITVAGDRDGNTAIVTGGTVDGLLNSLHSEVGVTTVNRLKESNLGVASQVDILGTVSDELHETSSHFICFVLYSNIFFQREKIRTLFPHNTLNVPN